MKRMVIAVLAALLLVPITLGLTLTLAGETGEVVVVTPEIGETTATRLWVVEHAGNLWLRAGHEQASWYAAVTMAPAIVVERDGVPARYRATPDPSRRTTINALMADKYGLAETIIGGLVGGRGHAIPIRLEPLPDRVPQ